MGFSAFGQRHRAGGQAAAYCSGRLRCAVAEWRQFDPAGFHRHLHDHDPGDPGRHHARCAQRHGRRSDRHQCRSPLDVAHGAAPRCSRCAGPDRAALADCRRPARRFRLARADPWAGRPYDPTSRRRRRGPTGRASRPVPSSACATSASPGAVCPTWPSTRSTCTVPPSDHASTEFPAGPLRDRRRLRQRLRDAASPAVQHDDAEPRARRRLHRQSEPQSADGLLAVPPALPLRATTPITGSRLQGNLVAQGHKQAFCLVDLEPDRRRCNRPQPAVHRLRLPGDQRRMGGHLQPGCSLASGSTSPVCPQASTRFPLTSIRLGWWKRMITRTTRAHRRSSSPTRRRPVKICSLA